MNGGGLSRSNPRRYYLMICATAAGLVLAALLTRGLEPPAARFWLGEGGIIESFSALGYAICILVIIALGGWKFVLRYLNLVVLLLFLCSRELDFDKRFTTGGIFKTSFYISPEVPLFEKIGAVAVILILGWAVIKFAADHLDSAFKAFFALHPAALSGALALACMVVAKTFDGIARKLAPWGIEVGQVLSFFLTDVEEILELGIPVFFTVAALAYFGTRGKAVEAGAG